MLAAIHLRMGADTRTRVLIVDDQPLVLRSLQRVLGSVCEVFVALSASEAVALMAVEPIDVVITDYKMPVQNGVELLRVLLVAYPSVRRILHTAAPPKDIEQLKSEGLIQALVLKPAESVFLRAVVLGAPGD